MNAPLLAGKITAFLGCTDEHQLSDAIDVVRDGGHVSIVSGPSRYITLEGESRDGNETMPWWFGEVMAGQLPMLVERRVTDVPARGSGYWSPLPVEEYLTWALGAFDHLDLLSVGPEIAALCLESEEWSLDRWVGWLADHGGGDLITYDQPQAGDAPIWLHLGDAIRARDDPRVRGGVAKAAGVKHYDMGFNWLTADPWLDPVGPLQQDLGPAPSPLAVLRARFPGRYPADPADTLPGTVTQRLSSGADLLADVIWRPHGDAREAHEVVAIGDDAFVVKANDVLAPMHELPITEGCHVQRFKADPAADGNFAFIIMKPESATRLQIQTAADESGRVIGVRLVGPDSATGSRWRWRRIDTLAIESGLCAVCFPQAPWTESLWEDRSCWETAVPIEVVPGLYAFEIQDPAAWRLRLETVAEVPQQGALDGNVADRAGRAET